MSDDLISRQNLMTTLNIKEDCHDCVYGASVFCTRGSDFVDACEAIMDAPSIDAVEVVRCRDCKWSVEHYDTDGNAPYLFCKNWYGGTDADGYCYEAERKEE